MNQKHAYEPPEMDIVWFESDDILTSSRPDQGNMGEWDIVGK